MKELVFIKKEHVFTTSLVIAEGTNNEHRSIIRLIQNHAEHFERWGKIRFTDLKSTNPLGGRPTVIAELNEQQATFLVTLLRNNDIVLDFKSELVDQFYKMRKLLAERQTPEWQQARLDSKIATRKMTDAIKNFLIPLAIKQGMDEKKKNHFFNNYNRLINKCVGVKADSRDLLTESQLYEMKKMSNIAGTLIEKSAAQEIDYHEIYFNVKDYLKKYAEISML